MCSLFEDVEEDAEKHAEEVGWEKIKKDDLPNERKPKCSFDTEDLSTDGIDEIMRKCDEKHPEGRLGAGAFGHASALETKLEGKETETENHELACCSTEAAQFIVQSQLSHVLKKISASEEK